MRIPFGLLTCSLLALTCSAVLPGLDKRAAPFESVRTRLDQDHSKLDEESEKYFHESTFHEHYDGRFADRQLQYREKHAALVSLIQTYLSSMNDIGVETFIVHGTLLGWWWNRQIMPWDDDIDVMVSETSIHHLAEYYNMTVHHYKLPGIKADRDYLLEVNPHYKNSSMDMTNKIDARWIDTDTGLFIDITTLRRNDTARGLGIDGAMMAKDNHTYSYDDIFPLRRSTFENFPVKVPFAYSDLLVDEYGVQALTHPWFNNHKFDAETRQWVALGSVLYPPGFGW